MGKLSQDFTAPQERRWVAFYQLCAVQCDYMQCGADLEQSCMYKRGYFQSSLFTVHFYRKKNNSD